ncbi:hypothetical protein JX265_014069, partial [Neoarthrinium moseri]
MGSLWLSIKSAPRGLPGPILQEHHAAYREMPESPQLILAIGSAASKARYIMESLPPDEPYGVFLRHLEGDAVLVDCSLHEAPEFERLRGGYTPSQVDKFCLGSLADVDGPSLAWTVYGKLLAPLSALVVV